MLETRQAAYRRIEYRLESHTAGTVWSMHDPKAKSTQSWLNLRAQTSDAVLLRWILVGGGYCGRSTLKPRIRRALRQFAEAQCCGSVAVAGPRKADQDISLIDDAFVVWEVPGRVA